MAFIRTVAVPRHGNGRCARPDSKRGTVFGVGTIWQCDDPACGKQWHFDGFQDDQRDPWDKWTEVPPDGSDPLPTWADIKVNPADLGCTDKLLG